MHILPLTIALILIFAISTTTLLEKKVSSEKLHISYLGYMNAFRKTQNALENEFFNKIKRKRVKSKTPSFQKKNGTVKKTKKNYVGSYRLNIYPLILKKNNTLYRVFVNLIRTLYENSSFFKNSSFQNLEYLLADRILAAAKWEIEKKNPIFLEKLKIEDPFLHFYFYKMLKGTKYYNHSKKVGFPSLLDFITINPTQTTNKIYLNMAPKETLISLFNKEIAREIINKRKKDIFLNKDDLNQIFTKIGYIPSTEIWEMLNFSSIYFNKSNYYSISKSDKKTHICIKRKIYVDPLF